MSVDCGTPAAGRNDLVLEMARRTDDLYLGATKHFLQIMMGELSGSVFEVDAYQKCSM